MIYYASALTLLGGLDSTPLRSLLSKLVEPNEYGKIYTFAGIAFLLGHCQMTKCPTISSYFSIHFHISLGELVFQFTNLELAAPSNLRENFCEISVPNARKFPKF